MYSLRAFKEKPLQFNPFVHLCSVKVGASIVVNISRGVLRPATHHCEKWEIFSKLAIAYFSARAC